MIKAVYQYFLLKKGERRALVILLTLLIFGIVLRIIVSENSVPVKEKDSESFLLVMNRIKMNIESEKNAGKLKEPEKKNLEIPTKKIIKPFAFNPNEISLSDLLKMNLPEFVARNLIAYREAGGVYSNPEDLKKIYGMDRYVLEKITPYIQIPSEFDQKKEVKDQMKENEFFSDRLEEYILPLLEINDCDSITLQLIPGIGSVYASRIVKYRSLLGGFHDFDQLWEVYGMDTFRFESIKKHCSLDTLKISKLNLKDASFRELMTHPYLDRKTTYALVQFRDFSDTVHHFNNLLSNQVIDYKVLNRIRPYLEIK